MAKNSKGGSNEFPLRRACPDTSGRIKGDDTSNKMSYEQMNKANYYYNKRLKEHARRLRKQSTKAEIKLWNEVLRGGQMYGCTFLRQRPVLKYIVDFMCKDLMLIIEVDGYSHEWAEQWELDMERQKELEEVGFTVLRFTDEEVLGDIRNVRRVIELWVEDHPPAPLQRGNLLNA